MASRTILAIPNGWATRPACACLMALLVMCGGQHFARAQEFGSIEFDSTAPGLWSAAERTTVIAPQVLNGTIVLDGMLSDEEYGGFEGVPVIPGDLTSPAWILDFPASRTWNEPADSSLTFWLAHDTDYLYIGAQVMDDVVNGDNERSQYWKDDSIELVFDALNNRYDINAGTAGAGVGGQAYLRFDGQLSAWDPDTQQANTGGPNLFPDKDWSFGESADVYSVGSQIDGGWSVEARFRKSLFEDPTAGNELVEGYTLGFNIGVDDDDQRGSEGTTGSGDLESDLEIQYWWSNRERFLNWNEDESIFYTEAEIEASLAALRDGSGDLGTLGEFLATAIDSNGRFRGGGAGEVVLGPLSPIFANPLDCNSDGAVSPSDLACVTQQSLGDMLTALRILPGDFNGDRKVDFGDFVILSGNFLKTNVGYTGGDANLDGSVGFPDFVLLSSNFLKPPPAAASSVPEPSAWLLLLGSLGLLTRRRARVARVPRPRI